MNPETGADPLARWLAAAGEGAALLTSNGRAARFLRHRFDRQMRATGHEGWATPAILTLDGWLQDAWQELPWTGGFAGDAFGGDLFAGKAGVPLLMNSSQEQALWMRTIASNPEASPLNVEALADLAMEAWASLHAYGGSVASLRSASLHRLDWQQFRGWCEQFSAECQHAGWTTRAELPQLLTAYLRTGQWAPARRIVLWGFDSLTPAQRTLVEALASAADVTEVAADCHLAQPLASASCIEVKAPVDEYRAAARWARARLQANPEARLAILTTAAGEERGALSRALSLRLDPAQFSFSLGHPLAHVQLVRHALTLLRWPSQALAAAEIGDLLLAPQLCRADSELRERAVFETERFRRRSSAEPAMHLAAFAAWLKGQMLTRQSFSLMRLQRQCEAALQVIPARAAPMTAEDWAARFRGVLAAFEYPAQVDSSESFQAHRRWDELLDEFAGLSLGGEKYSLRQALRRLESMAAGAVFQPQSKLAGVTVMGPLEAAGSLFDGIFFLGCTEERWPLPEKMNPLLPVGLQQSLGMPGAVRGASLQQGRRMTARIVRSAPEVIFSYAANAQGGEVRPSPLLRMEAIAAAGPGLMGELVQDSEAPLSQLQSFDDASAAAWTKARRTVPSSLLAAQAACPFKAFALHRLRARGEDLPEEGFDNMQRGLMLHKLLESVWLGEDGLVSSEGLKWRMENGTLDSFVRAKADVVVKDAEADGWQREFLAIERERLSDVVCRWLREIESKRAPFVVREAESEHSFELIDALIFNVRLDRVDALVSASGPQEELVLLDYKSGALKPKAWTTPRMDEPQMPLYALHTLKNSDGETETPAALALAGVRSIEICLQGMAEEAGILPLRKNSIENVSRYQEALVAWHADIENMAYEFVTGVAHVDPKYGETTCRNCELQPLCRVRQREGLLDDEEDEEPND